MPWLNYCCCRIPLRTGTILNGILDICVAIGTLVFLLVSKVKLKTVLIDWFPPEVEKIIVAINLVMTMLISLLLVIGAMRRNRWLMLPWICLAVILVIGMVLSVIYNAYVLIDNSHAIAAVIWLIIGISGIVIFMYLWVVVFSYYQLLEAERSKGPYNFPYGPGR